MTSVFAQELAAVLPDGAVVDDHDVLETYRRDRTAWLEPGRPLAAAFPTSTDHVVAAVKVAGAHRVPIVPRGAGSSLAGGAMAVDGCLILCTERMDRILEVDPADQMVSVEPGVLNADVSTHVAEHGLWYPPDPASAAFSTIGGNVATNAGGLCCVKYGVTRDHVLGLEVVLADGTVLETGRRTIKGVAGLDLTSLFVGSEGTLGIVTRARLRLRPIPPPASTLVAFFATLGAAGTAVVELVRGSADLSLLEVMDRTTIGAVEGWRRMDLDTEAAALLLVQVDAAGPACISAIQQAAAICDAAGATYTALTDDPEEGASLLEARRLAYPALERLGTTMLDDVAVPRSRIPALVAGIEAVAERRDVTIGTFGHAGDGNLHPTLVVPHGDQDARARALEAFADVVRTALDLGGTITGEHGVGALKRGWLESEVGAESLRVQRILKSSLDPQGLFNPGRAL